MRKASLMKRLKENILFDNNDGKSNDGKSNERKSEVRIEMIDESVQTYAEFTSDYESRINFLENELKSQREINSQINSEIKSTRDGRDGRKERMKDEDEQFLDEIMKNYDEIIQKLIDKNYAGIVDEILKEEVRILKRRLRNYEYEEEISSNPESIAVMNQIINTCSKIMNKKI